MIDTRTPLVQLRLLPSGAVPCMRSYYSRLWSSDLSIALFGIAGAACNIDVRLKTTNSLRRVEVYKSVTLGFNTSLHKEMNGMIVNVRPVSSLPGWKDQGVISIPISLRVALHHNCYTQVQPLSMVQKAETERKRHPKCQRRPSVKGFVYGDHGSRDASHWRRNSKCKLKGYDPPGTRF